MLTKISSLILIFAALTSQVFATSTLIAEDTISIDVPQNELPAKTESSFELLMDPASGRGAVDVQVKVKVDGGKSATVLEKMVIVPNLKRKGNDLVFHTHEGEEILCGTYDTRGVLTRRAFMAFTGRCEVKFTWAGSTQSKKVLKTHFIAD